MYPTSSVAGLAAMAVTAIAAGLSAWMFKESLGAGGLPGCGAGSACDAVTKGRWSRWGRVPVSAGGAVLYVLILAAVILRSLGAFRASVQELDVVVDSLALIAIGTGVWFMALQALVIRRLCVYCTLIHVCGILGSCILLIEFDWGNRPEKQIGFTIAAIGLLILVAGQIILKPRTFAVVKSVPQTGLDKTAVELAEQAVSAPKIRSATNRRIRLRSGRVVVNMDDFPVIGPVDAEHVIAWLFDYTCEECHHLHGLLLQAVDSYAGRLAVLAIPIPLNPSCNPTVKCHAQERAYSCAYARLGWAMWTTDVDRHAEWDRFMAEEEQVKPFGVALLKAKELADISHFKLREEDPVLDQHIAASIAVHQAAGEPILPALLLPGGILLGHVPSVEELVELLNQHLKPKLSTSGQVIVSH